MKIVGIIAEYNPFHMGHLYHLKESLKALDTDTSISVMSGNFTQRGEPAMVDKWVRGKMAVQNGISLVLELPFIYACNSAEHFAKGAVRVLNSTRQVTHLSFGSESGQLKPLLETAELLAWERADYKSALKDFLSTGLSFPRARQRALEECFGESHGKLLSSPNNILGVEYLKQLLLTDSSIAPITVKRFGSCYKSFEVSGNWASAMAIRKMLESPKDDITLQKIPELLPEPSWRILEEYLNIPEVIHQDIQSKPEEASKDQISKNQQESRFQLQKLPVTLEDFLPFITYKIISTPDQELADIFSVGEGLEHKIKKALRESEKEQKDNIQFGYNSKSLIRSILSKRYTETGVQRMLIHLLMNLTKKDFTPMDESQEIYCRVLAGDPLGRAVLKRMRGQEVRVLQNRLRHQKDLSSYLVKMLEYDIKASDVYHLVTGVGAYGGSDLVHSPYFKA